MFHVNVGGQAITLGGIWLLLHLMLRLWFTLILYQTGVQGASWWVHAHAHVWDGQAFWDGCALTRIVSNCRSALQGTLLPFTILEGEHRNLLSTVILPSCF